METVVEIFPETAELHFSTKLLRGCRHHPHIHLGGAFTAEPLKLLELKHPEQLHLRLGRNLADLVEKDRPAICLLEGTPSRLDGSRKRSPFVAEELAFE